MEKPNKIQASSKEESCATLTDLRAAEDVVEGVEEKLQKLSCLPDEDDGAEEEFHECQKTEEADNLDNDDDNDENEEELRELEKVMTVDELQRNKEQSDKLKLDGNELFKNDEPQKSVQLYTEALKICPTTYSKERAILYGNRAAAKIKLDAQKAAIADCAKAITLWPEYVRALLRRAKLYEQDEKLDEALEDYKRVCELDPSQREAQIALTRLPPLIQERNERMKEEMMSKLKDLGNMILKPFGLSTSNFQMQQDPNTGSYSINFNQNAGGSSSS